MGGQPNHLTPTWTVMSQSLTFLQTRHLRCVDLYLISKGSSIPVKTQFRPQVLRTISKAISQVGVTPDIVPVGLSSTEALPYAVAVRSARAVVVHP